MTCTAKNTTLPPGNSTWHFTIPEPVSLRSLPTTVLFPVSGSGLRRDPLPSQSIFLAILENKRIVTAQIWQDPVAIISDEANSSETRLLGRQCLCMVCTDIPDLATYSKGIVSPGILDNGLWCSAELYHSRKFDEAA
ncbi:hypothetical protein J1614_003591 [Plenodomus biglobosus]|nr:hypothetical protein J1614_003591 [Plenodomus biglobosus]